MIIKDIYWLAGLLEGEGCFTTVPVEGKRYPRIDLRMTDYDVVSKARNILGSTKVSGNSTNRNKEIFTTQVNGNRAIQWMMTLYSLMGARRQERIKGILNSWKQSNSCSQVVN